MPMRLTRITTSWLRTLKQPVRGQDWYQDEEFRPFRVCAGTRSVAYYVQLAHQNRRPLHRIGPTSDMSPADARNEARARYSEFAKNGVLSTATAARGEVTLRAALALAKEKMAKKGGNPKTYTGYERWLELLHGRLA